MLGSPQGPLSEAGLLGDRRPTPDFIALLIVFWVFIDDCTALRLIGKDKMEEQLEEQRSWDGRHGVLHYVPEGLPPPISIDEKQTKQ